MKPKSTVYGDFIGIRIKGSSDQSQKNDKFPKIVIKAKAVKHDLGPKGTYKPPRSKLRLKISGEYVEKLRELLEQIENDTGVLLNPVKINEKGQTFILAGGFKEDP